MHLKSVLLLPLALATSASAWGGLGHRTVAYLAEKHLTHDAKALVGTLLANPNNYDISDGAVWADKLRDSMAFSKPYHFINPKADKPPGTCRLDWPSDCPREGCIISAIANYVRLPLFYICILHISSSMSIAS